MAGYFAAVTIVLLVGAVAAFHVEGGQLLATGGYRPYPLVMHQPPTQGMREPPPASADTSRAERSIGYVAARARAVGSRTEQAKRVFVNSAAFAPAVHPSLLLLGFATGGRLLEQATTWLLLACPVLVAALGWLLCDSAVVRLVRLVRSGRSRDESRGLLSRFGETLSSSLDLGGMLAVVVETAMDTLAADRAVLMLLTPERDSLYPKVGRGVGTSVPRVRVGQGLVGWVAQTGTGLLLPADAERAPCRCPGEPGGHHQLLVPLPGRGFVIGVLSLIRDDHAWPFTRDDFDTMMRFAAQASVAIENVMLYREAQRLSVTDPLTGLWNLRYLQIQADRELESAVRFQRPLSLGIIDVDHFKEVNDRLGHQVGDEVLTEVARRIRDSTRVPDVVARYGGEEFVVLLPGTDFAGALATVERIREAVAAAPVAVEASHNSARPLSVTCSGGVSSFPVHGQTLAGLLQVADGALYTAKAQGRNRIVGATSD
jgi:diguanylate cyclase (GGDEF)-like protein